jgi:hypothetical protein
MAKSALGRGLQNLMKEPPVAARPENPCEKAAQVTPGMAALLRGGNGEIKASSQPDEADDPAKTQAAARKGKMVQTSLVLADLLLMALVARLAFVSHGRFGMVEVFLCGLALAVGAWLSCLALWLK